jgi:hypothetical protein
VRSSRITLLLFSSAACGCAPAPEERAAAACEIFIKDQLKAPATYRRISSSLSRGEDGIYVVFVTYDAQNAFGVPLRSHQTCRFSPGKDGALPDSAALDANVRSAIFNSAIESSERLLHQLNQMGDAMYMSPEPSREHECCLSSGAAPQNPQSTNSQEKPGATDQ